VSHTAQINFLFVLDPGQLLLVSLPKIIVSMTLSKTHTRILGTLLFVLEQKTEQIEHIIRQPAENAAYTVEQDLKDYEIYQLRQNCEELKKKINRISAHFGIKKRKIHQYQYISTIQSQMWEHISDAFSEKLKGYGEKLKTNAKQVDPFIQELSETINLLKL
jgi:chromosomal replication initiation ATPase DnaA